MKLSTFATRSTTLCALALAACGGGGGTLSSTAPGAGSSTSIVTSGAITGFGSVFVNGTRFDVSAAAVTDNGRSATPDDLKVGQMVRIEAERNDGGSLPRALRIDRDSALEGTISAIDSTAGTLTVLGQTVVVDADTLFDDRIDPASLDGLAVGQAVEIDAFVAADGSLRATRIGLADDAAAQLEVTGRITALDGVAKTFEINALTVVYDQATLVDFPADGPADGQLVEVTGASLNDAGQLVADRVRLEHVDDDAEREADEVEVEGLVTRFMSATDFDVEDRQVTTTDATVFENGTAADLALGVKLEVEGQLDADGVLVAAKVALHHEANLRIDGNVDAIDAAAGTLEMLGITVAVDTHTRFDDRGAEEDHFLALTKLAVGDHVEVRGVLANDGSGDVLATRLERESGMATTVELTGPVASVADPSFMLLGTTVTTTPTTTFSGLVAADLFTGASLPFVEVRGTWDGTTLTATEVKLADSGHSTDSGSGDAGSSGHD